MIKNSQITFLYFADLDAAIPFFEEILGLTKAMDEGWCKVWQVAEKAFLGGVDVSHGSVAVKERSGTLISITVPDVDAAYEELVQKGVAIEKQPHTSSRIPLRSFFIKGPEGYDFEIQQFLDEALYQVF
ncbi:VOC family protein [Eubacteriales bacterium OttesenSCG-928-M02]|nr:VOC family protein [Eubacteriales bacterium OttesenSCG-928-M02]